MPRRLLPTIAVVALAAMAGGAGCADQVSPALRIGDLTVSHDELTTELGEWAGNQATQASQSLPLIGIEHGYALEPASAIIGERIIMGIFEEEFDRRGLEVTDDDRANAFLLIGIDPAQEEELLGGFSDEFHREYLDRWARVAAIQADNPEEDLDALLIEGSDDVELSSRYGTWDPTKLVVSPPPGPPVEGGDQPADAASDPTAN